MHARATAKSHSISAADKALFAHLCLFVQISEMQAQIKQLQEALTDAETKVLQGEMVRRKLHNVIQVRGVQPVHATS
jgi:hypothetical protein